MVNENAYKRLIIEEGNDIPIPMRGDVITKDSVNDKVPGTEIQYTDSDGSTKTVDSKWFTPKYQDRIRAVVKQRYGSRRVSLKVLCEIASELEANEDKQEVASWFGLQ